MVRTSMSVFLGCCYTVLALGLCSAQSVSDTASAREREAMLSWAREQATALHAVAPGTGESDLSSFGELVGDARIVLLGDSRHDAREQWLLKHRLIEFLVRDMGFSVLAMEESLPCTAPLNAFLLGQRDDLETAQSQLGAWYIWDTEEFRSLMKGLRAHNDSVQGGLAVRLYGFDVSEGVRRAVGDALALLDLSSPEVADRLRRGIDLGPFSENSWAETMGNYARMAPEAKHALGDGLAELVTALSDRQTDLVARSGGAEYEWVLREAMVASQAHEMMVSAASGGFTEGGAIREAAMADNLLWLMRTVVPGERIIVWAHNFHVSRAPLDIEIPGRPVVEGMKSLGYLLAQNLADSMVSVGFSFERGLDATGPVTAEDWVDGVLADVGLDVFLLNLRTAPSVGLVHDWLSEPQVMRGQGGRSTVIPKKSYDALVFVRELARTTPTENAKERFASLGWQ